MAFFQRSLFIVKHLKQNNINTIRLFSSMSDKRGLILGVYSTTGDEKNEVKFTKFGEKFNSSVNGKLLEQVNIAGPIKEGETRVFWSLGEYDAVAVSGIGKSSLWDINEEINGANENIRIAASAGTKSLISNKVLSINVEDFGSAQSAAEGAILSAYKYQEHKREKKRTPSAKIDLATGCESAIENWKQGVIVANAQNWARILMETPANKLTPTIFHENVKAKYAHLSNVTVVGHDRKWAENKKMESFLSVTNGSNEPPVFLEITYNGGNKNEQPFCLVGKGVTFDSGGISIKPSGKMDQMRGDMGGAANVVAAIGALAELGIKCNVKGLIPLCENMPSGSATKPGDVVTAMNGKTICVDNTDAEGRLILADALCYSAEFKPKFVIDLATLTGAIKVALGDCLSGVFTNNNELWNSIHEASCESGDRVWRMPLFKHYTSQMCDHDGYDLNNVGKGKGGGSCTAAAFLREFVPKDTPWMHIDIAGVMCETSDQPYVSAKMSGRPLRTLTQFIINESKKL